MNTYWVLAIAIWGSILTPASGFAADVVELPLTVNTKCLIENKGSLEQVLSKKLTGDLVSQGVTRGKARAKLTAIEGTATPAVDLRQIFGNTALDVTPVECVQAPCDFPPNISLRSGGNTDIDNCTVSFKLTVKYSGSTATEGGKKRSLRGSAEGVFNVVGKIAPRKR